MPTESSAFSRWLDLFGVAWATNSPEDIARLVPDTFEWHSSPFAEIFRDRQTLVDHWISTVNAQSDVSTSYQILCEGADGVGICRYEVSYLLHKTARIDADAIFRVQLDADERCVLFEEWFITARTPLPAYV